MRRIRAEYRTGSPLTSERISAGPQRSSPSGHSSTAAAAYPSIALGRPRRWLTLLAVLLPLLVGLLAWRQYDALSKALLPLYLTEKAPDWLRSVFYGMLTAAAVLLSMLPGLWTILLSRNNRNHF